MHERLLTPSGKRLVLIAAGQNEREHFGAALENDCELLYAEDGQTALELIRADRDMLSLILADLQLPVVSGQELLRLAREDPSLRHIPVVILTDDRHAELNCLELGAADVIFKPCPEPDTLLARVKRTIELSREGEAIRDLEHVIPSGGETPEEKSSNEEAPGIHLRAAWLIFILIMVLAAVVLAVTDHLIAMQLRGAALAADQLRLLIGIRVATTALLLLAVLGFVIFIDRQIRIPLNHMVESMQKQQTAKPAGVEELRFAARTYNAVLLENLASRERLSHEASHDALTGLLNRGAYELLFESVDKEHIALLLIDVDRFKQINDTYGHAVGDRVLKRVAEILRSSFRSVDIICRFGGDEFVVIMTRANSEMRQLVSNKIKNANELLMHPKDDLPPFSLSVGVAFSDRKNPKGDIFIDADAAAYRVKNAGGAGCAFHE